MTIQDTGEDALNALANRHGLVFDTDPSTLEHLCDHVLSRPEAVSWRVLLPNHAPLLMSDFETRDRFVDDHVEGRYGYPPESIARAMFDLIDAYLREAALAVADAERFDDDQRWLQDGTRGRILYNGLGLHGVFVAWEQQPRRSPQGAYHIVATAYVPLAKVPTKHPRLWSTRPAGGRLVREQPDPNSPTGDKERPLYKIFVISRGVVRRRLAQTSIGSAGLPPALRAEAAIGLNEWQRRVNGRGPPLTEQLTP